MNKKKHLILVGGGHAHMVTLAGLHTFMAKGFRVTVIAPSEYHYYSGMGPGLLGKTYRPEEIRFATRHVVEKQGGTFVLEKVSRVDPDRKTVHLESGDVIPYDVISFNAGSHVPGKMVSGDGRDVFTVKPIENILKAQARILDLVSETSATIAVVGGGPSAVEIAGNVWRLVRDYGQKMPRIVIFAGRRMLSGFPGKVCEKTIRSLTGRGIEIKEDGYVKEILTSRIILDSGDSHSVDLIFLAHGIRPSPVFKASGLTTGPDDGLLVNQFLQNPDYAEVFGGGDCIYFKEQPLDKVGVYAVRANSVLYHNLMASLTGAPLQSFNPGGDYLQIFNMGDDTGVFRKKFIQFDGHLAFRIKDYIDRRFIRRFQAIE